MLDCEKSDASQFEIGVLDFELRWMVLEHVHWPLRRLDIAVSVITCRLSKFSRPGGG